MEIKVPNTINTLLYKSNKTFIQSYCRHTFISWLKVNMVTGT